MKEPLKKGRKERTLEERKEGRKHGRKEWRDERTTERTIDWNEGRVSRYQERMERQLPVIIVVLAVVVLTVAQRVNDLLLQDKCDGDGRW